MGLCLVVDVQRESDSIWLVPKQGFMSTLFLRAFGCRQAPPAIPDDHTGFSCPAELGSSSAWVTDEQELCPVGTVAQLWCSPEAARGCWLFLWVVGEPLDFRIGFSVVAVKEDSRLRRRSLCLICRSLITEAFRKCKDLQSFTILYQSDGSRRYFRDSRKKCLLSSQALV